MAVAPSPAITLSQHLGTMQQISILSMANYNKAQALIGQLTTLKNNINSAVAFSDSVNLNVTNANESVILAQEQAVNDALTRLSQQLTIPT